ncbi:MAG: aspartate aminotransferase family protein [Deltaproteobacteria bacterium]|nr:aspartate aminotransferase family protein [Deltaproteobacteria bacterium]
MSSFVFHRRLDSPLPEAVHAEGVWIEDKTGKRYMDASGGPICVNIGHGRTEVADAMARQARDVAYVHGTMFTTRPLEALAERLSTHAPEGIDRFYFCSSGSEAVETAIKLARQVQLASGHPGRYRIISRWLSYHGSTMGALSVTGKPAMRNPFTPMLMPVIHIPPPYCLRCHFGLTYPVCGLRCAHALADAVSLEGPDTISAFLAETICGATMGAVVPPIEYYDIIADICRHYGILLILDEVMCGMGRTGKWFAAEHYALSPDLMILGKGLAGGYAPLSAVGCSNAHVEVLRDKAGSFVHGHTYSHHAVAAAAGLTTVKIIEAEDLVSRAHERGQYLARALGRLRAHSHVADVRGKGLMQAVEIVADKDTLAPFPRSEKITERIRQHLMDAGIITYPSVGFGPEGDGDGIMFGPPFVITEAEIDQVVDGFELAIHHTFR